MKRSKLFLLLAFFVCYLTANGQSSDLKLLKKYMSGSFTSREQHLKDTANFFEINLQMNPIWQNRTDGYWLYVEQATAASLDKPYRQRIYHLTEPRPGTFVSEIFTMKDPLRFANHPELTERLTIDSLTEKEGCEVVLHKSGKSFSGGTIEKNCPSDRKGAAYATTKVTVQARILESWDQGFNAAGEQVWGAEKGGYRFLKVR